MVQKEVKFTASEARAAFVRLVEIAQLAQGGALEFAWEEMTTEKKEAEYCLVKFFEGRIDPLPDTIETGEFESPNAVVNWTVGSSAAKAWELIAALDERRFNSEYKGERDEAKLLETFAATLPTENPEGIEA